MLTTYDRKKKQENFDFVDALCKSLGWYFPLLAKLRIRSVEALVFRKFPGVCPYCRKAPHEDLICKQVKGTAATVNHDDVVGHFDRAWPDRPKELDGWQLMFNKIYPRQVGDGGRSSLGLLEELGELAEAIRVFDVHPRYFLGEAADIFSYIMGLANEHSIREAQEGRSFSFGNEFVARYPGLCTQCGSRVCTCPAIPQATVGRLAKELTIRQEETLFITNTEQFTSDGEAAAHLALESVGGYLGLSNKLPFDRGGANHALVMICLKIAAAVEQAKPEVAGNLRAEALRIQSSEKPAGVRASPLDVKGLLNEIQLIWKELDEQFRNDIKSSSGIAGDLVGALNADAPVRVLFVSCDPEGTGARLNLDAEQRAIKEALKLSPHGGKITLELLPSATTDDLRRSLLENSYDIVHFSGHANRKALVFADSENKAVEVPISAVADLIKRHPSVRCVILNGCETVKGMVASIADWTIGMDKKISEPAALQFSKGFYDAVGAGKSIRDAYDEGVSAMTLASHRADYVRILTS
ncbi:MULTISPECIES: CHAT domain-containing protein [unclassified Bradyrhizobium]|uniref:CHAT domain-containing protein n=1 Tax=unclassified Bradyrhizobium TaxID=2631580 RepID=UPI001CD60D0F|nr:MULTISPECIES: CHAT domain-containing protein [unclassified Bradyrhizobium]MCA1498285.1 CHAT domain-containing protein [Bradyrhizobium sp. NBAIM14]MCA1531826.1 CHAT domain-containing protein [Bradyrhizobium sp. NBAIM03]